MFPFQTEILNEKKWKNRLHVAEVFGSIVLCSLAPIICVSVTKYTFTRFPPLFGLPTPAEMIFFSIVLPLSIILAVGVNITFYTLLSIHKVMHTLLNSYIVCILTHDVVNVLIRYLLPLVHTQISIYSIVYKFQSFNKYSLQYRFECFLLKFQILQPKHLFDCFRLHMHVWYQLNLQTYCIADIHSYILVEEKFT